MQRDHGHRRGGGPPPDHWLATSKDMRPVPGPERLSPECLRARGPFPPGRLPIPEERGNLGVRISARVTRPRGTGPRSQQALSRQGDTRKHSKKPDLRQSGLASFFRTRPFFFFFLNLFVKKHTCAAVFVQRVRTQNKYVIGHSGRFTVSQA